MMMYPVLGLLWLLHWLPLPVLDALGSALGELLFLLVRSRRRVTLINLRHAFPELDEGARRRLAREHFRHMACALLSQTILWWGSARRIRRLVRVRGYEEHMRPHDGQPLLLLAAHFVGLEWAAQVVALQQRPGVSLFRHQSSAVLNRVLVKARTRFMEFRMFSRQDGIKPIVRALREGLALYYLPDQDYGPKDSLFVPFFGVPAATVGGLSRLSALTGAAVVPCITRRLPFRGFEVVFYPAWEQFPGEDVMEDTRRMNAFIEDRVREMPAQYFWSHQRYKTRPPGEPPFYG